MNHKVSQTQGEYEIERQLMKADRKRTMESAINKKRVMQT